MPQHLESLNKIFLGGRFSRLDPAGSQSLRAAFLEKQVPSEAMEIILAFITPSTAKQYKTALKKWEAFCTSRGFDCLKPQTGTLLSFLTFQFEQGGSYSTINCLRSAISLISHEKIGGDPLIGRFLRGVFKLRPSLPEYSSTWDVATVLDYLSSLHPPENLSTERLTKKAVMLLALSTASRAQTLANIDVRDIKKSQNGLEIRITKLLKTSGPGKRQLVLRIPKFYQRPDLCVATYVEKYLEKTRMHRGTENSFFLAIKKPHKKVGAQTISRWIKNVMKDSGIDTSIFSAHSTRHAATSAAFEKGVCLDIIRKTAGWSERSTMFAKIYQQPIENMGLEFANNVLINNVE